MVEGHVGAAALPSRRVAVAEEPLGFLLAMRRATSANADPGRGALAAFPMSAAAKVSLRTTLIDLGELPVKTVATPHDRLRGDQRPVMSLGLREPMVEWTQADALSDLANVGATCCVHPVASPASHPLLRHDDVARRRGAAAIEVVEEAPAYLRDRWRHLLLHDLVASVAVPTLASRCSRRAVRRRRQVLLHAAPGFDFVVECGDAGRGHVGAGSPSSDWWRRGRRRCTVPE